MWFNRIIVPLLKSPLHGIMSKNAMLITFCGRKSGKTYTIPVNYVAFERYVLSTSRKDRTWWCNLRDGQQVTLRVAGKKIQAKSLVLEDVDAVRDNLNAIVRKNSMYARFFNIGWDEKGKPQMSDISNAAKDMVVVRFNLL